ncbi:MAG: hypothetical protein ACK45I_01305 [Bacteroidota bacterium]|jgi:hypothetical protein
MKYLIIICSALLTLTGVYAQPENDNRDERIESLKIAFITEKLALSSKEAQVFWPVYNEFSEQLKLIKDKQRDLAKQMRTKTEFTDQEAEKLIQDQVQLRQQEYDLTKKYVGDFKRVLPVKKVARLMTLEDEFRVLVMQRLRDARPRPNQRSR